MQEIWGNFHPDLKLADIHIHTNRSDGLLTLQQVVDQASALHLSTIAITDHEVIEPAVEAKIYCLEKDYPLEVVIGSEISTCDGHLLGLYLAKNIPSGKGVEWTISAIHDQEGLAIIPHPMYRWTRSIGKNKIRAMISHQNGIWIDGFEIFNGAVATNPRTLANDDAREFYRQYQENLGAALGGTDTHFFMVGRGLTGYQDNLRESIKSKTTAVFSNPVIENITVQDLAQQTALGLFVEPGRRIGRLVNRKLNGED